MIHNHDNAGPLSSVLPRPYNFSSRSVKINGSVSHPSSILAGWTSKCPYTQTVFNVLLSLSLSASPPRKDANNMGGNGCVAVVLGLIRNSYVPPNRSMCCCAVHCIICSMSDKCCTKLDDTDGIATASRNRSI